MKVLALVPSFFGPSGDAVNERQLLMALARRVEKCYIITFIGFKQIFTKRRTELKIAPPKNVILISLPFPQINILIVCLVAIIVSCFTSIISLILNMLKKIDLIYIRNSFLSIGFLTFQTLAQKTIVKIPSIVEDEITDSGITKFLIGKLASIADRLALAKAGKIAVNGKLLYYELVRRRSLKHKDEPLNIPPGVNLSLVEKVKNKKTCLNSSKEHYIVGFLGLIMWWQGVDILVKSVAKLKDACLDKPVKLLLVGDGPERREIEELCKKLEVAYEVTGFVEHDKALEYLSTFDVLVVPRYKISTTESIIPIKVIEAWALGVSVIVTRHKVFEFYDFKNYEDVVYCEPTPENVAEALVKVLSSADLRRKLSEKGPQIAKHFDYQFISKAIIEAFNKEKCTR
jgi:glycosyltransferase involved in cell wall biosynthesis